MKICRIYLLPHGEQWCDFPVHPDATAQSVWPQIMADGVVSSPVVVIPRAQIHHMLVTEVADSTTTLTVFPGGKLN